MPETELIGLTEHSLKNICREAIRSHLLQMSEVNLFVRVPSLPLPKALQSYLLYDQALDDVVKETDESSGEAGSASESDESSAESGSE